MQALTKVSPVPIGYEEIPDGAKGYYYLEEKRIALQEGMSQIQNSKTAIHEIAHATLHDIDLNNPTLDMEGRKDRKTKEVEAESIAYAVCQHFFKGIGKVIGGFFRNRKANKAYEKKLAAK